MDRGDFQLKVLTTETRYLMANDNPTIEAYVRMLLGQEYASTKLDCEACSKARVSCVLYAVEKVGSSRVRTFVCMDCGVDAASAHMPNWDVKLYMLGIEIKMEATIDDNPIRVDNNDSGVPRLPAVDEGMES